MKWLILSVKALPLSLLAIGGGVRAQADSEGDAIPARTIEEVVVTAPKREMRLEDVPASIAVVQAEDLENLAVDNVQELARAVPGLVYPAFGSFASPTIRGVQTQSGGPNSAPSTAIYLDGLYMQSRAANLFDLPDVQQIEVLKGPQGTIAGRNALGGAIFIQTVEPGDELRANVSSSIGTFDGGKESGSVEGYVAGPVTDTLAASFAAGYNRNRGFVHNDAKGGDVGDDEWSWFARGKLRYDVTEKLSLLANAFTFDDSSPTQVQYAPAKCAWTIAQESCLPTEDWHVQNDTDAKARSSQWGSSLRVKWYTNIGMLTSLTGYVRTEYEGIFDSDGTAASVQALLPTTDVKTFSEELHFASNQYGRFSFIAGVAYFDINIKYNPLGIGADDDTLFTNLFSYFPIESIGVFAEGQLDVTDRLTLLAGTRFTRETKGYETGPTPFEAPPPTTEIGEETWTAWTPRFSIQYEFADRANVYLTYSEGFRGGQYSNTSFSPNTVDPERLDAYELGLKVVRYDVRASASIFQYDLRAIQANAIVVTDLGGIETRLQNAASGEYLGGELNVMYSPVDGLDVTIGASYLKKAEFDGFAGATFVRPAEGGGLEAVMGDLSGGRIPLAPELTVNAGVEYRRPLGAGQLALGASLYYSDEYHFDIGGFFEQPEYTTVNVHADWTRGNWTYSLWGKNVTNEAYSRGYFQASTLFGWSWAPPRQIGVSARYTYR